MSQSQFVKVAKNPVRVGGGAYAAGAWAVEPVGLHRVGVLVARFCGTHQDVPFEGFGRTPGRALRNLRRKVEAARIPVR